MAIKILIACLMSVSAFAVPLKVEDKILEIALHEYDKPTPDWDLSQRDCAGFIRYVFKKALTGQGHLWKDNLGEAVDFASAEHLVHSNFHFFSKDVKANELKTGDLLVFYSAEKEPADRYHLMLLLKSQQFSIQKVLVIYHNGAERPKGQIKRVWLDDLAQLAGSEWAPNTMNKNFQGVYRW